MTTLPTETEPLKPELPTFRIASRQTRYLAQAIQLEETSTAPLVRISLGLACLAVLLFVIWTGLTHLEEVATAEGQVVPTGLTMTVQHLEGGIIDSVLITEGELVGEGQPLVRMSAAASQSDLEQSLAREAALKIKAERLRAFVEDRSPDFSFADKAYDHLVKDNTEIFKSQIESVRTGRAVLEAQIEQKNSELQLLKHEEANLQDQVNALAEELTMRQDLVAEKLVTRVQYLDTKREEARVRGELSRTIGQAITATKTVTEYEHRLSDLQSTSRKQAMEDMSTTIGELAQVQESIGRLKDRVTRLAVLAPAQGYVKGLTVHNPGAVVQPGGVVCEIVPVNRELKVEAKVSPRDVGFLKPGQKVKVKVLTYDFARYGSIPGVLENVSASSFLSERGDPYFKTLISLEKNYVGDDPSHLVIGPGMTVTAEIITGEKTLLQYMLKPIYTSLQQSFRER